LKVSFFYKIKRKKKEKKRERERERRGEERQQISCLSLGLWTSGIEERRTVEESCKLKRRKHTN